MSLAIQWQMDCQQLTICQTGDVLSLAEANTATLLQSFHRWAAISYSVPISSEHCFGPVQEALSMVEPEEPHHHAPKLWRRRADRHPRRALVRQRRLATRRCLVHERSLCGI
jgi:hypothetical protein